MKLTNQFIIIRIISVALFIAVLAGTWDVWWHGAIGRETLWEPPHLLLYSAVLVAIISGIFGWRITKEIEWRNLAIVLFLVPISAPFDELWHQFFGVEDLTSPLIVWSPPHIAIVLSIIISAIFVLKVLKKDTKESQTLFGSMLFAVILSMGLFLLSPLDPFGPWHLLGFYGAGIISLLFFGIFLIAKNRIPGFSGVFLTAVFFLIITSIGFSEQIAEGVTIIPHDHPPPFIIIFSTLIAAGVISLTKINKSLITAGIAGFLWSSIIYGFSWMFFNSQYVYTSSEGAVAIVSSTMGVIFISLIYNRILNKREK